MADLRSFRSEGAPFDVTALGVPAVFGMGGAGDGGRTTAAASSGWGPTCPVRRSIEIEGAQHGAHLSHPDHFAALTRLVVERATASASVERRRRQVRPTRGGSPLSWRGRAPAVVRGA